MNDLPREDVLRIWNTFMDLDGATPRQLYNAAVRELPEYLGVTRDAVKRVVLAGMGYERPPRPT